MNNLEFYWGDGERKFNLTLDLIEELERVCGQGVGRIASRVFTHDYDTSTLRHTLRIGLIGGGTAPERADQLVSTYFGAHGVNYARMICGVLLTEIFEDSVERVETPRPIDEVAE